MSARVDFADFMLDYNRPVILRNSFLKRHIIRHASFYDFLMCKYTQIRRPNSFKVLINSLRTRFTREIPSRTYTQTPPVVLIGQLNSLSLSPIAFTDNILVQFMALFNSCLPKRFACRAYGVAG